MLHSLRASCSISQYDRAAMWQWRSASARQRQASAWLLQCLFTLKEKHLKHSRPFCVRTFTVHLCVPLPFRDLEQLSISIKIIFGDLHWPFFFWVLAAKPSLVVTLVDRRVALTSRTCRRARTERSSLWKANIHSTSPVFRLSSCAISAFPSDQLWWVMCCAVHVGLNQPHLSSVQINILHTSLMTRRMVCLIR